MLVPALTLSLPSPILCLWPKTSPPQNQGVWGKGKPPEPCSWHKTLSSHRLLFQSGVLIPRVIVRGQLLCDPKGTGSSRSITIAKGQGSTEQERASFLIGINEMLTAWKKQSI